MKKKNLSPDTSPLKLVSGELAYLRKVFRETLKSYSDRVDGEIAQVHEAVKEAASLEKVPASRFRDARDMIAVLRSLSVKPEKGRRRDLKKLESLVEDLQSLTENW